MGVQCKCMQKQFEHMDGLVQERRKVSPVRQQWGCIFLALTHRHVSFLVSKHHLYEKLKFCDFYQINIKVEQYVITYWVEPWL